MKKQINNFWIDRLYDDVFPSGLVPWCPYCGTPIEIDQQFCCDTHENMYFEEMDAWATREEEEYLREKKEE